MSSAPSPSASSVPASTRRFSEVDGLRAVACAMVILSHVGAFGGIAQGGDWLNVWRTGRVGVLIFFAISGFVIPSSLRGLRWEGVKRFAVRRFWRLYPPYWVALLLTCFFWGSSHYPAERLPWDMSMLPSLRKYAGLEHAHGFSHFWTLEVELLFYILVALLFLIFAGLRWKALLSSYITLGLCIAFDDFPLGAAPWYSPLPALMVMFWGALCREVLRFDLPRYTWLASENGLNWSRAVMLGLVTSPLVWLGIWSTFYAADGWGSTEFRFGLSILCTISCFLVWVVLRPVRINWLSHVGRWTYSAYLFHGLVIHAAVNGFILLIPYLSWLSGWPLPVYAIVTLVLSFAVGAVAYRWIEQPSDAIGKRLAARPPTS